MPSRSCIFSCSRAGRQVLGLRSMIMLCVPLRTWRLCAQTFRAETPSTQRNAKNGRNVMFVELVQTTTRDGLRLDGAFQKAMRSSSLPVDGFCFFHGTGGNFYGSTLFDALTERLLA